MNEWTKRRTDDDVWKAMMLLHCVRCEVALINVSIYERGEWKWKSYNKIMSNNIEMPVIPPTSQSTTTLHSFKSLRSIPCLSFCCSTYQELIVLSVGTLVLLSEFIIRRRRRHVFKRNQSSSLTEKGKLETAFSIPTEWEINASVTFN